MDAVAEAGNAKLAARMLGINPATIEQHMWKIGQKIGTTNSGYLKKHLLWDRFRQAQKDATQ
jgi:DNA-binding CsgD family transcriptional regulator